MAAETQARELEEIHKEEERRLQELEDVRKKLEKLLEEETQAKRDEEIVRNLQARLVCITILIAQKSKLLSVIIEN